MALPKPYVDSTNKMDMVYVKHGTTLNKVAGRDLVQPTTLAQGNPAGDNGGGVTKTARTNLTQKPAGLTD